MIELTSLLSLPFVDKTQYFVHLSFNSTLQLINEISSDLQKLPRYFDGTAIVVFLKSSFGSSAPLIPNNLTLYLQPYKIIITSISALKSVASSFV